MRRHGVSPCRSAYFASPWWLLTLSLVDAVEKQLYYSQSRDGIRRRGSRPSLFMIIPNTKRHPNNTKTDQLPISEVITGRPRPYHHTIRFRASDVFFVGLGNGSVFLRRQNLEGSSLIPAMIIQSPKSSKLGPKSEHSAHRIFG